MTAFSRRTALGALGTVPLAASGVLATAGAAMAGGSTDGVIPAAIRYGGPYDRYLAHLASQDRFSGTVLVARRGRTVLARSYGMADKQRAIPNRIDTIFNLASAAKPFTGLAVVQLAERGKLRFYDKIGTHLSGFPAEVASKVTIHHLLTHTGGLTSYMGTDVERVYHSVEEWTETIQRRTRELTLRFTPGTDKAYSSEGYEILGEIVATVSGRPFQQYVREQIFAPAGMTDSAYYTRPRWLTDPRIAHPYIYQQDGSRVDGVRNLSAGATINGGFGSNAARGYVGSGGGGGFSTGPDLVRFALALQGDTLLKRPYRELYLGGKVSSPPLAGGAPADPRRGESFQAYGPIAGSFDDQRIASHGGGIAGGNTNWSIYLDTEWVGVVLANYDLVDFPAIIDQEREAVAG
ncbi:serine hydrolase domain-containing protein [Phytohabitans sp. ZYX-F-186]|uniref:Serine hydrolase domain-containing protein n=1 Tax=Phytohabitans maris TaxID=3071409 RepID=A0ABU0ZDS2_9ACTN|nr:serine hydrolase domain-containing protein [Phytohabitans sp. ZYX-F-186]MDQ7905208.1 serine hydrolase domain-containing protein [Phytohabitans sp. ZYX-F-186]